MTVLSRRYALFAAAGFPFAPALLRATPARADIPMQGATMPTFNRFRLGAFEVTTLLAGTRTVDAPQDTFGLNVDATTFQAASDAAFIPADKAQFFFTPTLVNTGAELVLFDTGLDPDSMTATLAAAGVTPDQVDTVVITHMHGDHIGGLMRPEGPTFTKARYIAGAVEDNHWAGAANEKYDAAVRPLADRTTYLDDAGRVTPGIIAMAAFGHSPGHMIYMLESEGRQLVITADTANHYVWSLAHPDWEVRFDADKPAAAATRKAVFGMLAADRIPFIGYHMPFPGIGYVEANGDGFRYVPASYQMML